MYMYQIAAAVIGPSLLAAPSTCQQSHVHNTLFPPITHGTHGHDELNEGILLNVVIIPPSPPPSPIRLSVVLTKSQHHMQRAIVIPAGSQHERLAVPIRKQRHTCMSTSATQQVGLQGMLRDAACCLLLAACLHTPVDSTGPRITVTPSHSFI
jgi:hypothetical protein